MRLTLSLMMIVFLTQANAADSPDAIEMLGGYDALVVNCKNVSGITIDPDKFWPMEGNDSIQERRAEVVRTRQEIKKDTSSSRYLKYQSAFESGLIGNKKLSIQQLKELKGYCATFVSDQVSPSPQRSGRS